MHYITQVHVHIAYKTVNSVKKFGIQDTAHKQKIKSGLLSLETELLQIVKETTNLQQSGLSSDFPSQILPYS